VVADTFLESFARGDSRTAAGSVSCRLTGGKLRGKRTVFSSIHFFFSQVIYEQFFSDEHQGKKIKYRSPETREIIVRIRNSFAIRSASFSFFST
jgi:hypothetical protein